MAEATIRLSRALKSVEGAQSAIRRVESDARNAGLNTASVRRALRELNDTETEIMRAIRNAAVEEARRWIDQRGS